MPATERDMSIDTSGTTGSVGLVPRSAESSSVILAGAECAIADAFQGAALNNTLATMTPLFELDFVHRPRNLALVLVLVLVLLESLPTAHDSGSGLEVFEVCLSSTTRASSPRQDGRVAHHPIRIVVAHTFALWLFSGATRPSSPPSARLHSCDASSMALEN
mmetsp:Transcript_13643/g.43608  ORF Transcript_13643/g.43608 Transcript_13643/m.43608 type:complete len:162 (-) Transcript_13643:1553-2038(-)